MNCWLRRALVLAVLLGCSIQAKIARADEWWGEDKALHFSLSAGLGAGGYALGSWIWPRPWQRALAGATLSLSAGVAKELWDLSGHGDPSFKDLTWDAIGTGVGVGLAFGVDALFFQHDARAHAHQATLMIRF